MGTAPEEPIASSWRKEFGAFLTQKRNSAVRADYQLPAVVRGKTLGLRREEVSFLSNMSVTWYTWLEQGRDVNPSREVLASLAAALRLSEAEQRYVFSSFGYAPPATTEDSVSGPAHVKNLLDAINPNPALALTRAWDVVAWNSAYAHLFPRVEELPENRRNLLRMVFTDPAVRALLPDWEATSSQFLAEFRAETSGPGKDPAVSSLVTELLAESEDFAAQWNRVGIRGFIPRTRTFNRADGQSVTYGHHQLTPADAPTLKVIVYTPL